MAQLPIEGRQANQIFRNRDTVSTESLASIACLLVARGLRILPYFAGIFRGKLRKLLILGESFRTLDQHIGVRIPGGPNPSKDLTRSCDFPDSANCALFLCPSRINRDGRGRMGRCDGILFRSGPDVAVAHKHLLAEVSGECLDGWFRDIRVLRESADERVSEIVPAIGESGFSQPISWDLLVCPAQPPITHEVTELDQRR